MGRKKFSKHKIFEVKTPALDLGLNQHPGLISNLQTHRGNYTSSVLNDFKIENAIKLLEIPVKMTNDSITYQI